ncbi:hypothetical protein AB0392_14665 [Nonomuraea angiospora]|uniref:hypothetical protein n=1 Tax=Nonomuraea angiospora TaxID=46172 RepID=UPI00344CCA40
MYGAAKADVPITGDTLLGTTRSLAFTHGPLPARRTTYHRVTAVDRAGNVGPALQAMSATTLVTVRADLNDDLHDVGTELPLPGIHAAWCTARPTSH